MRDVRTRAARPQVEVMEGRLVLSALAGGAMSVHAAAVRRVSLIRNLTPQLSGTNITSVLVDPRMGLVQIQGTVTLPAGFATTNPGASGFAFNVSVNQAIGRFHSVSGTATALVSVPASPQSTVAFTVRLTASNGRFGRGYATVSLPDYSTGSPAAYVPTAQWLVWMTRARLA
jgi:hypothetical protein